MPMDFPDMNSLKRCAKLWKFRVPNRDETEEQFREALANFVKPKDYIESLEIRNKVGWDRFSEAQIERILQQELQQARQASAEYITKTDPLISCGYYHDQMMPKCGTCRACLEQELQQAREELAKMTKWSQWQECARELVLDYPKGLALYQSITAESK